ncbi:unnamed protein product, partial [Ectocarpus fasciculatus]
VDALFLKVLKAMGSDNTRFPCMASLINDRMKNERVGYNVVNSEYGRFANVLARFEADKMVGTSKARESVQVNWTKFSAPGSGTGARRPESRRETEDTRVKIRTSYSGGPLVLHFCTAEDEDKMTTTTTTLLPGERATPAAGDGDDDGGGGSAANDDGLAAGGGAEAAATPYAEIASILQVNAGELHR